MSFTSTTARTPYSTVKPISEVSTSDVVVPGDTPAAVGSRPNTSQGCRPVSVKIQPKAFAANGSSGNGSASQTSHRAGARPRRVTHSNQAAIATDVIPTPIINRKVQ